MDRAHLAGGRDARRGLRCRHRRCDLRAWHTLTVPWWAAGPLAATGRDLAWAGPAALWNGHAWVHGNPDAADLGMAGVPWTSATLLYSYGRPSAKSQQIAGSIWLNGEALSRGRPL